MFSRLCVLTLCSLLFVPASASAAPFTETALTTVRGSARCAHSTATPDTLAVRNDKEFALLRATTAGLTSAGWEPLDMQLACVSVAVQPNGAGVAVGVKIAESEVEYEYVARLREPGGSWGAPLTIGTGGYPASISTAISDRGDAVVAWEDQTLTSDSIKYAIRAARRRPGAGFGAPVVLASQRKQWLSYAQTGISADGEAIVLWSREDRSRPFVAHAEAAIAPADGAFAPTVHVGEIEWGSAPALAVAPDGRALVAVPDGESLRVAERAPGGGFEPPVRVAAAHDERGVWTSVAIGAGGQAAVAWHGDLRDGAGVVMRSAAGAFGTPVTLSKRQAIVGFDPFYESDTFWGLTPSSDGGPVPPSPIDARLLADGRVAVAWVGHARFGRPAHLATVPLGGGPVVSRTAGGLLHDASRAFALVLADGTPALAWVDDPPARGYGVHLAADGAQPSADPPAPRVRVGAPAKRTLAAFGWLRLPVTCSGPCHVRAHVGDSGEENTLILPRGGRGRLNLSPLSGPIAPPRLGPVRIRITYGPPNAREPNVRTMKLRLVRAAGPPEARVVALRAVRRGNTIRVSWRTDQPAKFAAFDVTGAATRRWSGEPPAAARIYSTKGRRSFQVTLRNTADVRWVTVRALILDPWSDFRRTVVAVS